MTIELPERLEDLPEPQQLRLIALVSDWYANQQFVSKEVFPYRLKVGFGVNVSKETVTMALHKGQWFVLLSTRPANDPDYPGQPWHSAGKIVIRNMHHTDFLQQISSMDETGLPVSKVEFAGGVEFPSDPRGAGSLRPGHWVCLVFVRKLMALPPEGSYKGRFFPIDVLPDNMVASHKLGILPRALNFHKTGAVEFTEVMQ